jgi:hypothetical protein
MGLFPRHAREGLHLVTIDHSITASWQIQNTKHSLLEIHHS